MLTNANDLKRLISMTKQFRDYLIEFDIDQPSISRTQLSCLDQMCLLHNKYTSFQFQCLRPCFRVPF